MSNKLPVSNLVDITINLLGAAATVDGFGVPCIVDTQDVLGATSGNPILVTCYTLQDVIDAGYKPYHKAYKLAAALLSQSQRVKKFIIAATSALDNANLSAIEAANANWYALLVTSRTSANIQTVATWVDTVALRRHLYLAESQDAECFTTAPSVLSALQTANRLRTAVFARKANAQTVRLTISAAFVALNSTSLKVCGVSTGAVVYGGDSDTTLAALAAAIAATVNPLGGGAFCTAVVVPVAAGADNDRSIDITAVDPLIDLVISDYACTLGASQNTAQITQTNAGAAVTDASAAGKLIPQGLGQATFAGKTLSGPAVDDLGQGEYTLATDKGGNVYVQIGNVDQVQKGQTSGLVAAGAHAFIDTIAMRDRLESDIQAAVVAVLTPQVGKLPFNNAGIAAVFGAAVNVCQRYVSLGMIEPFNVGTAWTVPDISQISPSDKTARHLAGITGNLQGTGAIQSVALTVNIQV